MFRLSTVPPSKKEVNGRKYKLTKWSTITTSLEGMKIAKVIAPSFAMMSDLYMGKSAEQKELEAISQEVTDNLYLLTGAVTQFCAALEEEHYEALVNKLMGGLAVIEDDEARVIEDWSQHFDLYPEDFGEILMWSIKENLLDFFMKQATFVSKIEMAQKILTPIMNQVESLAESNTKPE